MENTRLQSIAWRTLATAGLVVSATSLPRAARGQGVAGVVVDEGGHAVRGVVTMLLDSAGTAVARTLSGPVGEYRLVVRKPGRYRVSTLRVGFRPTTSAALAVLPGRAIKHDITLSRIPAFLGTMHVEAQGHCEQLPADSETTLFTLWEQARAAMAAAHLMQGGRAMVSTTIAYDRTLEVNGRHVLTQQSSVRTEYVREPWRVLPSDSLRQVGYIVPGPGDYTTYYGPSLETLLSNSFVEDHCFRLGVSGDSAQLALDFEPSRKRRGVPEVRGTLWLDRKSAELRRLEFRYVNVPREEAQYAGGSMDFATARNGGWLVWRWSIRMPQLERPASAISFRGQRLSDTEIRVAGLEENGGVAIAIRVANDTLWSHPMVSLSGTVVDSASGLPIAASSVAIRGTTHIARTDSNGHFALPEILPGEYTLDVRTPALDSAGMVHGLSVIVGDSSAFVTLRAPNADQISASLCGGTSRLTPGIIDGILIHGPDDSIPSDLQISAEWSIIGLKEGRPGQPVITTERRQSDARLLGSDRFRLCNVPVSAELIVTGRRNGQDIIAGPILLRIPPFRRIARVSLRLSPRAITASLHGSVSTDSSKNALAGAQIELTDLGRMVTSDKAGAYQIDGIPAGVHRTIVRDLGYAPIDTTFVFAAGADLTRNFILRRAVSLEAVNITATEVARAMQSFEDHRRLGLGQFITRDDLERRDGMNFPSVLESLMGVPLDRGTGNQAWAVSRRGSASLVGTNLTTADQADVLSGAKPRCYVKIYLDGRALYRNRDGEPLFDLQRMQTDHLEAVEYYSGPAETPAEYSDLDSTCGVLVLWTRRR